MRRPPHVPPISWNIAPGMRAGDGQGGWAPGGGRGWLGAATGRPPTASSASCVGGVRPTARGAHGHFGGSPRSRLHSAMAAVPPKKARDSAVSNTRPSRQRPVACCSSSRAAARAGKWMTG
jgi:hypothetical protein